MIEVNYPLLVPVASYLSIFIELASLVFKLTILYSLYKNPSTYKKRSFLYLSLVIITGASIDLSYALWGIYLNFFKVSAVKPIAKSLLHIVFVVKALHFYALLFFFKGISSRRISSKYLKSLIPGVIFFGAFFTYKALYILATGVTRYSSVDWTITRWHAYYYTFLGVLSLLLLYRNYKVEKVNLLKRQLFSLLFYFMLPYFFAQALSSDFVFHKTNFFMVSVFSCLFTGIFYYCLRKLLPLRFMNMRNHVESNMARRFSFPKDFVGVINKFGLVTNTEELIPLTGEFFNQAFGVSEDEIHLCVRYLQRKEKCCKGRISKALYVEKAFADTNNSEVARFAKKNKILIYDEIEFTHFYGVDNVTDSKFGPIIEFLDKINAAVFLPIYNEGKLVAYIILNKVVRERPFSDIERDEMIIYSNYLSSVLYILSHMDIEGVLEREYKMELELYSKNRYRDLMERSFLYFKTNKDQGKIGVLTYKDGKFGYCNNEASELIKLDLNEDKGVELATKISKMVADVAKLLISRKKIFKDSKDRPLVVSVSPNKEKNNTLLTISSPTATDLIKDEIGNLKDQSKWGYLLALHTSEEGKIVNRLIPANSPVFLNSKVSFFENAITKKSMLLELSSGEDALLFARAAHKIGGRRKFEEIAVNKMSGEVFAKKLFGINPILDESNGPCLLEKLNGDGTLLIQNIHLLSLEMQAKLLDLITTGKFRPLQSDKRVVSRVLLICSGNRKLSDLVKEGSFSKKLYSELRKSSVFLPDLTDLPEEEVLELAEGFRKQVIYNKLYHNLLALSEADKKKIGEMGCISLSELKTRVKNLVLKKTQRQTLEEEKIVDPAYDLSDLELIEAVRLGKHALRDPETLRTLMEKFNYSQSKVADFLSVNRSSVSRRCQEYDIQIPSNADMQEEEDSL